MRDKNPETDQKKCGESCGCQEMKEEIKKDLNAEKNPKTSEKKTELDPTHFGDWQVNCRAIDF